MRDYLQRFLLALRPAFSRQATFQWLVMVVVGFVVRSDTLGVTSILRGLYLAPGVYPALLHFFHSHAWSVQGLMLLWWLWLRQEEVAFRSGGRVVLLGDHTKTPKEGRRIPAVTTLHQDSQTASKPSFFRGHQWACVSLLVQAGTQFFATPLWALLSHPPSPAGKKPLRTMSTEIVHMAQDIAQTLGPALLVLDAFFAVGPVFLTAARSGADAGPWILILTRAKNNVVAYLPPPQKKKPGRGRPRKYGCKLKLRTLFDRWSPKFQTASARVYQKRETIRFLTLDLYWKPVRGLLRFFLLETSHGRIILVTSDPHLSPVDALELYCHRVSIETLFDTLKNTFGAMGYHFWSKYLTPVSRRPLKNQSHSRLSSQPAQTHNTLQAIQKFVNLQLLTVGLLQLLARQFPLQVRHTAHCWLRTVTSEIPSEFVTRIALANVIRTNLFSFASDWITQLILPKQKLGEKTGLFRKAG